MKKNITHTCNGMFHSSASNVLINGEQLQVGVNVLVAIYAHGTDVIPQTSTFKPLTVYTKDHLSRTSKQLAINTFHNNLRELDNTDINGTQNVTPLLGFNEPDHTDQANIYFQQMIDL